MARARRSRVRRARLRPRRRRDLLRPARRARGGGRAPRSHGARGSPRAALRRAGHERGCARAGDDDPQGEGPRVRHRHRARHGPRAARLRPAALRVEGARRRHADDGADPAHAARRRARLRLPARARDRRVRPRARARCSTWPPRARASACTSWATRAARADGRAEVRRPRPSRCSARRGTWRSADFEAATPLAEGAAAPRTSRYRQELRTLDLAALAVEVRRRRRRRRRRPRRARSRCEFDWASETARHVGTVTHRWLQRIGEEGVERWDAERVAALAPAVERELDAPRHAAAPNARPPRRAWSAALAAAHRRRARPLDPRRPSASRAASTACAWPRPRACACS